MTTNIKIEGNKRGKGERERERKVKASWFFPKEKPNETPVFAARFMCAGSGYTAAGQ